MTTDDILIVGGGTAGWLTAAYLAKQLGGAAGVRITLVESSDIATIGVGEGTFPTIAQTLASLGVDEAEFMREAPPRSSRASGSSTGYTRRADRPTGAGTTTIRSRCRARPTISSCCRTGCRARRATCHLPMR